MQSSNFWRIFEEQSFNLEYQFTMHFQESVFVIFVQHVQFFFTELKVIIVFVRAIIFKQKNLAHKL